MHKLGNIHLELQRAITQTDFAASPYFSIINGHLVNINVSAKFDEIPSLSVLRKNQNVADGQTDGKTDGKTI